MESGAGCLIVGLIQVCENVSDIIRKKSCFFYHMFVEELKYIFFKPM